MLTGILLTPASSFHWEVPTTLVFLQFLKDTKLVCTLTLDATFPSVWDALPPLQVSWLLLITQVQT